MLTSPVSTNQHSVDARVSLAKLDVAVHDCPRCRHRCRVVNLRHSKDSMALVVLYDVLEVVNMLIVRLLLTPASSSLKLRGLGERNRTVLLHHLALEVNRDTVVVRKELALIVELPVDHVQISVYLAVGVDVLI